MNEQHLAQLQRGVENWNAWRQKHPKLRPDLSNITLNYLATKSTLDRDQSIFEQFQRQNFKGANFANVNLRRAKLWLCDLDGANFQSADLQGAEIRRSWLKNANFQDADLRETQFITCDMTGVQFNKARFGATHLGYTKLQNAQGLEEIEHSAESYLDQFSLLHSFPLPNSFIAACNVSPFALRMVEMHLRSPAYRTCFLSYSRRDETFVGYLREVLTWNGVPSWFAPHDMRDERFQANCRELERDLYNYIDKAELLLLVMSPNILSSSWVGLELLRAERNSKPIVALLIDPMNPKSEIWNQRIAIATKNDETGHFRPNDYAASLEQFLATGRYLYFADWRNPIGMAYHISFIWPHLIRTA